MDQAILMDGPRIWSSLAPYWNTGRMVIRLNIGRQNQWRTCSKQKATSYNVEFGME